VTELYNVSRSGPEGAASRVLVFLNFPVALAAIALVAVAADRLASARTTALASVSVALCAVTFWPGVVDQNDLDARWVNALPALGVGLALALTLLATSRSGVRFATRRPADPARIAIAAVVVLVSVPWLAADLGFSLDGVPVLGWIFQTGDLRTQPGSTVLEPAVHHGHHHGSDSLLLVLTALLLSRGLHRLRHPRLRVALLAYLALMLVYGLANLANDGWLEQIVKRGWTSREIPDLLTPAASLAWAILLALTVVIAFAWVLGEGRRRRGDQA
jgi:hypothetical protein